MPSILVVTAFGLIAAQFPVVSKLRGARVMAMLSVYLFLAVIGAYCDVGALVEAGELGPRLMLLATTIVVVHGVLAFGLGRLLNISRASPLIILNDTSLAILA